MNLQTFVPEPKGNLSGADRSDSDTEIEVVDVGYRPNRVDWIRLAQDV